MAPPAAPPRSASLAAASVLLIIGGVVTIYFAAIATVGLLPVLLFCSSGGSCPPGAGRSVALVAWLALMVMVTGAWAIAAAVVVFRRPAAHRLFGWTSVGLSLASVVGLAVVLPTLWWGLVVYFGGWGLFLTFAGGMLAAVTKSESPVQIPPGAVYGLP